MNVELPSARDSQSKSSAWCERQKSHERIKLVGLPLIARLILPVGFLRFGKAIPWGAR